MPRSNRVFGQDDGGGVGELFRELEDERHTAEKFFKPVFWKGLFRYFFLCASFFLFFADLSCQCCEDYKRSVSYQG